MRNNQVPPLEIEDDTIRKLLSFYLHYAPTIESKTATEVSDERLQRNWNDFFTDAHFTSFKIYSEGKILTEKIFTDNALGDAQKLSRKVLSIVCKRKNKDEKDYECVLRHIRNSIAHNNVYIVNTGNRKFVLFEDYNKNGNITSRMLLSQTILSKLKKIIVK